MKKCAYHIVDTPDLKDCFLVSVALSYTIYAFAKGGRWGLYSVQYGSQSAVRAFFSTRADPQSAYQKSLDAIRPLRDSSRLQRQLYPIPYVSIR